VIVERSQRWRDRRDSYVPNGSLIRPDEYGVDVIDCMRIAKPFVTANHYSASFPASRLSVGLFRRSGTEASRLVGVATFSQPMNNACVPNHTGLEDHRQGAELGRLVLLDEVAGNGETWFLSRAFRALRREKPDVEAVISYADPMIRTDAQGRTIKPGHVGQVYAVMGAAYRGRATSRLETLTPDGQVFSDRDLSKIRRQETGRRYATEELVMRGADRPHPTQTPVEWLASLHASGFLSKRRNPGNHAYSFELTNKARMAGRDLPRLEYPRIDRTVDLGDATALPLLAAA
jgi:hypothetical protein